MKPASKLLALATPALLLWSTPSHADAPRPAPVDVVPTAAVATAAPSAPVVAEGMIAMARILGAIAAATQATAPMCDASGRPLAGNVGKSMGPDHACSIGERFTYALAIETAR